METQVRPRTVLSDHTNIFIGFLYAAVIGASITTLYELQRAGLVWFISSACVVTIFATNWLNRFVPFYYFIETKSRKIPILTKFYLELFSVVTLALSVNVWFYAMVDISKEENRPLDFSEVSILVFSDCDYMHWIRWFFGLFLISTAIWNHFVLYLVSGGWKKYLGMIRTSITSNKYEEAIREKIPSVHERMEFVREWVSRLKHQLLYQIVDHVLDCVEILFVRFCLWHVLTYNLCWAIGLLVGHRLDLPPLLRNLLWLPLKGGWITVIIVLFILVALPWKSFHAKTISLWILAVWIGAFTSTQLPAPYLVGIAICSQLFVGLLGSGFIAASNSPSQTPEP